MAKLAVIETTSPQIKISDCIQNLTGIGSTHANNILYRNQDLDFTVYYSTKLKAPSGVFLHCNKVSIKIYEISYHDEYHNIQYKYNQSILLSFIILVTVSTVAAKGTGTESVGQY